MNPEFKFAVKEGLDSSFLPTKVESTATGWDVKCAEPDGVRLVPNKYNLIRLGFRMFAPAGWWLSLNPRSSTFAKKHLHCLYGVLDESWEGESMLACQWIPEAGESKWMDSPSSFSSEELQYLKDKTTIKFGERIGQIIPVRRQGMEVVEVSNEEYDTLCIERSAGRGAGGFGSTGDK